MRKILIVDDEFMAVKTLQAMIKKYLGDEMEIHFAFTIEEAYEIIETVRPELIFLDVIMPPQTGFDLLTKFTSFSFNIIFTTAYDNYAIQAIKYSALDYLLKPIAADELKLAYHKHITYNASLEDRYNHLMRNLKSNSPKMFTLAIPSLDKTYFIHPHELIRCESESNYTWFYLASGEKILTSKTLKYFDSMLVDNGFIRIHRSHLVNKKYILQIVLSEQLKLSDGCILPIARNRRDAIMAAMK
jgi:two-component system, LytTR family, response regulator